MTIPKYNIKKREGVLKKCQRGYELFFYDLLHDFYEPFEMKLEVEGREYQFQNFTMTDREVNLSRKSLDEPMQGGVTIRGDIERLKLHSYNQPIYHRFVINVGTSERIQFYIETDEFKDEKIHHFYGRVPVTVDGANFNIYEVHNESSKERYLFIDCDSPMYYEQFGDMCHSIMIGYGMLCATFFQNEAYYVSSADPNFVEITDIQYLQLRKTLKSFFNPIYGEPYGRTDDKELAEKVRPDMKPLSRPLFNKLCTQAHRDKDYAALIILILEANTASLILRPAGYSVALERLTNMIGAENDDFKPIKDDDLVSELKDALNGVLREFEDRIRAEGGGDDPMNILKKNIEKINQPTSMDKLLKPFARYNIKLSKLDREAIANRNSFLHGKNGKVKRGGKNVEATELDVYHITLRLNTLVNKLFFSWLGYDGCIINFVKVHEDQFSEPIDEDLFVKL